MKRPLLYTFFSVLAVILLTILLPLACAASRAEKTNSLSECVAKADIIVVGLVDTKENVGDLGVLKVRVLSTPLKGKMDLEELTIADRYFHSSYKGNLEGPPVVQEKEAYIFFLTDAPDPAYRVYHVFNSYDGFIHNDAPVRIEIMNQLRSQRK